jgi:hypothetical protein
MSFKDLEENIKKALDDYKLEEERKAAKVAEKAARRQAKIKRAGRPPLYRPDKPQAFVIKVVINARFNVGDSLGELTELVYLIPTMSSLEAELEAIKLAKDCGFVWRGTVSVSKM